MDIRNFFKRPAERVERASASGQSKKVKKLSVVDSKQSTTNVRRKEEQDAGKEHKGRIAVEASDFFLSSQSATLTNAKKTSLTENELNFHGSGTKATKMSDDASVGSDIDTNHTLSNLSKVESGTSKLPDKKRRCVGNKSGRQKEASNASTKRPFIMDADGHTNEENRDTMHCSRDEAKVVSKQKKSKKVSPSKKKPLSKAEEDPLIEPSLRLDKFDTESAVSECLKGLTFVFTGILKNMDRDSSIDFVKTLGGRVTNAVSGRTSYLVVGEELEDGRHYSEGSKFRKAQELNVLIVKDCEELYGLCKRYNDKARAMQAEFKIAQQDTESPAMTKEPKSLTAPAANPYSKKKPTATNPYAKKKNPYITANASASDPTTILKRDFNSADTSPIVDATTLWADKYAPKNTREILGNAESVRKLSNWLTKWEATFNNSNAQGKTFSSPNGPWKAALLSGPPGIGKTTTATLVSLENERDILEMNASDVRSKKALESGLGDITGSQVISFEGGVSKKKKRNVKRRCLIMDEVDGMGAGDRSGISELIKMIKGSRVPVICICNDRQAQKIKSLVPYCMDLRYKRPTKSVIARRAVRIGEQEGMKIEQNAAEAIAESCGNDIRQVLNVLQMWSKKKEGNNSVTYKDLKERESTINKDEILRVSMFDATKIIIEGRRGLAASDTKRSKNSLYKRSDAFFVDYSLMGLNVHQNYPKVMVREYQDIVRIKDESRMGEFLDRMHDATRAMSDFAIGEETLRGGDQNWSLLPFISMMTVKTGYHAGGENGGSLGGFPEFSAWLGKNSSRGKKERLLHQMEYHMNYKISSNRVDLRLHYFPLLRERFMELLTSEDGHSICELIELMDEYGLDRIDVFENMDEFLMHKKEKAFGDLDSKQKSKFTREYNKRSHKSQALVHEQGAGKMSKKPKSSKLKDPFDLDAVDDDPIHESEDDEEDLDNDEIKKLFQSKKMKGRAKTNVSQGSRKKQRRK